MSIQPSPSKSPTSSGIGAGLAAWIIGPILGLLAVLAIGVGFGLYTAQLLAPPEDAEESQMYVTHAAPYVPGYSVSDVLTTPDVYVEVVKRASKEVSWPSFNPRPEIIQ